MHNLNGYIDIHSHFLPGLDDGPDNFEKCLDTARRYVKIGVHCVIATSHYIHGTKWSVPPDRIFAILQETVKRIDACGIPLQVLPGMEIAISDFLRGRYSLAELSSLGNTDVFLVEFPVQSSPTWLKEEALYTFPAKYPEKRFVIAHPERCPMLQNTHVVKKLVNRGMMTQVNIGSVLGSSGRKTRNKALELIRRGLVHFLATDSHAGGKRQPPTPRQMSELVDILGSETVTAAFRENPLRLLQGKDVQPVRPEKNSIQQGNKPSHIYGELVQGVRHFFNGR